MPSKSKAQARFFAAAAHNPDFAKKAGMSTKTAKEWNQADKKAGTLKKGSKKPEHVKEEVLDEELLDEASGVGNFPVPPSALKLMQKYASSIVLTLAYKSFQQMQQNTDDELDQLVASKILPFLKRFQRKYGAQVLNDESMRRYVNQSIKMPIDHEAIFRELPKSLQNDKVKSIIEKMAVFVTFDANYSNPRAGGHAQKINDRTSEIVLSLKPQYFQFSSTSGTDGITKTMERMDYFLGSLEHEMQHAFQEIVTTQISSIKDKNLEMKKGYGNMDDAYHASGVEFGPQTKDMINAGILWLDNQKDKNELSGDMNRDIKGAIQYAFKRLEHGQGSVYKALKNYKEDANAKKHMILIFKGLAKHYQEMENEEDSELDLEPKDVDGGENRMYHSSTKGPDKDADGNDPMVKIYRAMESTNNLKPYNVEEEREHGTPRDDYANPYNKLSSIVYHLDDGGILRFMKHNGKILLTAWEDRFSLSEGKAVNMDIPFDKADVITEYINWFKNFDMTERFINELQHKVDGSEMGIEDIADEFSAWYNSAVKKMGGEPEGKKLNAYIDEGTLYIEFKGLRIPLYMQAGFGDSVQIDNADSYDTITRITYKDLAHVMTRLFEIYLESTDRQFNRVFKNLDKTTTPDSLDNVWRYVQESSKAPVEESSMRGFMDLVQDAEIADGIDQANKMTDVNLMNKAKKNKQHSINQLGEEEEYDLQGKPVKPNQKSAPVHAGTSTERDVKLDEMPQRFDSFQGQDPDEFVDKTAELTGKANLIPFTEHPDFTVMRNKSYTGFIAFDKQGKQIAVVSGNLSQDAVLGVKNVFEVSATASKTAVKGVMYKIFMDMLDAGISILSDTMHSDSAIKFWTRLIGSHEVYIVGGGEVLAKATPEKVHKYWSDDENSPSAELQLLLTK